MGTDNLADLIQRLFAILTARCEDGASIAAEGQRVHIASSDQKARADKLRGIADEIVTVADAIAELALVGLRLPDT